MSQLYSLAERVAASDITVLILGETGVGKEVLAEVIHKASRRSNKPILKLNCAELSETLIESELFGHERGAFTGAVQVKPGLLETANGGTIFLDEIGEMPIPLQAKLLRVLEQREVMRIGALKARAIDVRFLAATNRDLEEDARRGRFRQDLFFRLNGVSLTIPPLRERVAEIEPLAITFAAQAAVQNGLPAPRLSEEALEALRSYMWPGNIRELRNAVERAVLLTEDGVVRPEHLPLERMRSTTVRPRLRAEQPVDEVEPERERIREALLRSGGNQHEAAALLGVSRSTLIRRLESYGVERPRKKRTAPVQD